MSYTVFDTGVDAVPPTDAPLDPDYDAVIGADASTSQWWHPDAGYRTLNGSNLSAVASQKASGGAALSQGTAASQPLLVASQIDGRDIMRFASQSVGAPDRFPIGWPGGAGLSWSVVMVIKAAALNGSGLPNPGTILSSETTNAFRIEHSWTINDGEIVFIRAGAGLTGQAKLLARPIGAFYFLEVSFNGATGEIAGAINGAAFTAAAVTGVTVDSTAAGLGARPSEGSAAGGNFDCAFVGIDTLPLHLPANLAKRNWWKQLARDDFPSLVIA